MFQSSGSQSPPPLHYSSPAASDQDRFTTRESTPVTTPVGFGEVSSTSLESRDKHSDSIDPLYKPSDPIDIAGRPHQPSDSDSQVISSQFNAADPDCPPIFSFSPPTPPSPKMSTPAPVENSSRQKSVSPPGQQASNLTSALQKAGTGERPGSVSHPSTVGISMFKAPPPRKESIGTGAQWGNGSKPISVSGSNRDKSRRESLAGSLFNQMSWGGVSVGSWIRDE